MGLVVSVVGATGLVGNELLGQLCDDGDIDAVHAVTRRPLAAVPLARNPKLTQHVVDFDRLAGSEWPPCDVLFCCLGSTIKAAGSQEAFCKVDLDYVVASARAARQAGATRLMVVSAMGANPHASVFYNRVKGQMEAAVASLGFDSVVIFRPSFLAGDRIESRPGERLALSLLKIGDLFLPKKYRSVPASAVARAMQVVAKANRRGVSIVESDKIQRYA
ncbi:MAG TPA: oxidoreductase [Oxalobacteraceae bacterium]|nr:oxidoreductase [Oxalobacteraceae bacterium]HCN89388.1 oxidoreductase [Oxalobacteraceae bacterium]